MAVENFLFSTYKKSTIFELTLRLGFHSIPFLRPFITIETDYKLKNVFSIFILFLVFYCTVYQCLCKYYVLYFCVTNL